MTAAPHMAEALKPCPFCGSPAYIARERDIDSGGAFHFVKCTKCGAKGGESYAVETCPVFFAAIRDKWNLRAPANAVADALEAERPAPDAKDAEIARLPSVKPLEWESPYGNAHRAPAPLFGSLRVERYGDSHWVVLWSAPGICDTFVPGKFPTLEAAKAACEAEYRARILTALSPT